MRPYANPEFGQVGPGQAELEALRIPGRLQSCQESYVKRLAVNVISQASQHEWWMHISARRLGPWGGSHSLEGSQCIRAACRDRQATLFLQLHKGLDRAAEVALRRLPCQ